MSSSIAVAAERLGKRYLISRQAQATTLPERLAQLVRAPFGRGDEEELWALRDVAFSIPAGSAVGVIGRNGAGKSTLLKILSRITPPTTGELRLRGRVGSLLEVGTGFHPELTGRENLFLNAAVHGLRRREVRARLAEIVAFADVGGAIDEPLKRWSAGMSLRLAFAVAAHLDPDVLLLDELLAVADARFRERCVGVVKDAGRAGRTVLLASHDPALVSALATHALHLDGGRLVAAGPVDRVLARYASASDGPPA
jgi:lipopolysaccharide transport system ATP-binding protein